MNRITKRCMLVVVLISAASAAVHKVPEDRPTIQGAINELANDGDTISVWGYGSPPYIYYENVVCIRACLLSIEFSARTKLSVTFVGAWSSGNNI